jgi:hypothetical protein
LREPRAHQTVIATEASTARTDPSAMPTLTTPGWRLLAVCAPFVLSPLPASHDQVFSSITWLYRVWSGWP